MVLKLMAHEVASSCTVMYSGRKAARCPANDRKHVLIMNVPILARSSRVMLTPVGRVNSTAL